MTPQVSSADVVVVGAGVVGAACARSTAIRGLRTLLLEPGPQPGAASPASAGMLAAQIEPADDKGLLLAVRARDLTAALASQLEDSTGISLGLRRDGIAALALSDATAHSLRREWSRQQRLGITADWLDDAEVLSRWPGVTPQCRAALYSPAGGAIDPSALVRALLADAARHGAALRPEAATGLVIRAGAMTGVRTAQGSVAALHTVVAAGAWSPHLAGLPRPLPIAPVRGQLAAVAWPDPLPPVILYHDHGYLLPRGAEAILGSTMEHAGFEPGTTPDGIARIVRGAAAIVPAVANAAVRRAWAGLRPLTPDGLPIVGPDPACAGLWYATGHGRNGVQLAALTGEIIADLITAGTTNIDTASWTVERFSDG